MPPSRWRPPAAVAELATTPGVKFSYREEWRHEHTTVPMFESAIDPRTYLGRPLGTYGVTVFAWVSVTQGPAVLGDYAARVHLEKPYGLTYGPTYTQLERQARAAVRAKLAGLITHDAARLDAEAKSPRADEAREAEP